MTTALSSILQRLSAIMIAGLVAGAAPVALAGQHPTSFMWVYRSQPQPGIRVWTLVHDNWQETYPDGHTNVLGPATQARVNGCTGSLITIARLGGAQSFVPDIDCGQMTLWFREPGGAWTPLGQMRTILYCPSSTGWSADATKPGCRIG